MFPITAAAGALSLLTSFLQSSTANVGSSSASNPLSGLGQTLPGSDADGDGDQSTPPVSATGAGASTPSFDPGMLAALLSLQGQQANTGASGSSGLFSKLDTNGDGQISKAEFESALGSNGVDTSSADALFSKLDTNGDGSVSQSELASAQHGHGHHHHQMVGAGQGGSSGEGGGLSSLLNSTNADGSTTKTATNADGSTTTTISYADGTTVDMTTPAASQNGGSSGGGSSTPSQSNLIEQLIKLQSQLTQSASTLSTIA